jgi:predicted PurR-regulated permease PerM
MFKIRIMEDRLYKFLQAALHRRLWAFLISLLVFILFLFVLADIVKQLRELTREDTPLIQQSTQKEYTP